MAALSHVYKPEDIYLFRLRKINEVVCTRVMHTVFLEATRRRVHGTSLFDFFKCKGVHMYQFKKGLNKEQMQRIETDPDGKSFDITLLYCCIHWGGDKVAPANNMCWREGNHTLESHLTAIKNKRNELYHREPKFSKREFITETNEIRKLLTNTLHQAESYYNIPRKSVCKMINDLDMHINLLRDNPLVPLDFADYKKHIFFLEQGHFLRIEGKKLLDQSYEGWVFVIPVSFLVNLDFKIDMIYTGMVLLDGTAHGHGKQTFENLLEGITLDINDPIILVEGVAGVGKTTMVKKILNDWATGKSTMDNLTNYDLLLYTECRNNAIRSFKDLITSWMSSIARNFQADNFSYVVLDQKLIILVDGLDELNSSSTCLFKELLDLKKSYGFTMIVTTRPERLETYHTLVTNRHIKSKHVKLIGISKEKRSEFVNKYHSEMKKKGYSGQDVDGLLNYLKRTEHRMNAQWLLPYNLTLIAILWAYNPQTVTAITTEAELYWQIHQMYCRKLTGRLLDNEVTQHEHLSSREGKVRQFVAVLSYEALVCLKNDDLYIPPESLKNLEDACNSQGLPVEEMTGAFLKCIVMLMPHGISVRHSFPHKGLQEFLGAHYFLGEAREPFIPDKHKVLKEVQGVLTANNLSAEISQDILRYICNRMSRNFQVSPAASTSTRTSMTKSTVIRDQLKKLHGSKPLDITKYQNMLTTLLGLFYLKKDEINNCIKLEVLELLEESGVNQTADWLRLLSNVKCDEFVATFISQQHGVFDNDIQIEDSTIFAFISILNAVQTLPTSEKTTELLIRIELQGDPTGLEELLTQIHRRRLQVSELCLDFDFQQPTASLPYGNEFYQIFDRCQLQKYKGSLTTCLIIPSTVRELWVGIANEDCYEFLQYYLLHPSTRLNKIHICISRRISGLSPIPPVKNENGFEITPVLYLPDIDDVEDFRIIRDLQPRNGIFDHIMLPRCVLTPDELLKMISNLVGVNVRYGIHFPASTEPPTDRGRREIEQMTRNTLRCDVYWKDEVRIWNPFLL